MPFSLIPCLKFRKKRKKGKKEKDIQIFSDIITEIPSEELWQKCGSSSQPSIISLKYDLEETNNYVGRRTQSHLASESDNLSINKHGSVNNNAISSHDLSTALSEVKERINSKLNFHYDIKNTLISEILPHKNDVSSSIIVEENITNCNKGAELTQKIVNETSGIGTSSHILSEWDIHKRSEIINNITVNSNVFEIIEALNAVKQTGSQDNVSAKSEESLEEKKAEKFSDSYSETRDTKNSSKDDWKKPEMINFVFKTDETISEGFDLKKSEESDEIQNERNIVVDLPDIRDSQDIGSEKSEEYLEKINAVEISDSYSETRDIKNSPKDELKNTEMIVFKTDETISAGFHLEKSEETDEIQKKRTIVVHLPDIHDSHDIVSEKSEESLKEKETAETSDSYSETRDIKNSKDELKNTEMINFVYRTDETISKELGLGRSGERDEIQNERNIIVDLPDIRSINEQGIALFLQSTESQTSTDIIDLTSDERGKISNICKEYEVNESQMFKKDSDSINVDFLCEKKTDLSSKMEFKSSETLNITKSVVSPPDGVFEASEKNKNNNCGDCKDIVNSECLTGDMHSVNTFSEIGYRQFSVNCHKNLQIESLYRNVSDSIKLKDVYIPDNSKSVHDLEYTCNDTIDNNKISKITDGEYWNPRNLKTAFDDFKSENDMGNVQMDNAEFPLNTYALTKVIKNVNDISERINNVHSIRNNLSEDVSYFRNETNTKLINTGCILNKGTMDVNVKCSLSGEPNIDLDIPCQNLMPQEIIDFDKFTSYSDSVKLNNSVHELGDEATEADIYTCWDGYCSDDSEQSFIQEGSEDEGIDCENVYNLCPSEISNEIGKFSSQESLRCHKQYHSLNYFQEDLTANNIVSCDRTGTISMDTCQEEFGYFGKNNERLVGDEYMPGVAANYGMSNEIRSLKNSGFSDIKMNKNVFEEINNNKLREENMERRNHYLKLDKNRDKKYLSSHSGSSELSDSGDAKDSLNAKESDSFIISACGENITNDRLYLGAESLKNVQENIDGHEAGKGNMKNTIELNIHNVHKAQNDHKLIIRITEKRPSKLNRAGILANKNTNLLPDGNIFNLQSDGHSFKVSSPVWQNICGKANVELDNTHENNRDLHKSSLNEEILKLKNSSKFNNFDEIENIRRQSLDTFYRKKLYALSVMKPDLRNIPIKKTESFDHSFCKVENFSLDKGKEHRKLLMAHKLNKEEERLNDSFNFPLLERRVRVDINLKSPQKHKDNKSDKEEVSDQEIYSSESDIEEICDQEIYSSESDMESSSDTSDKITPDRKRILNASSSIRSNAIRSPKYPFKATRKSSHNNVPYRKRGFIIVPSKSNLVTYVTKDEKKVYHIKRGFRNGNADSRKFKQISSVKYSLGAADYASRQTHRSVNYRATSPDDLKLKFDDAFRKYASKGRSNGKLMSYKRSTEWLRDAGVVGKALTTPEANAAFKCNAGVKVALNKGDYRHFLKKLTKVKMLNYNEIYDKLCSVANKYAEV